LTVRIACRIIACPLAGWLVDIVRFTRIGERGERLNHIVLILLGVYICDSMLSLFSGVLYNIAATRCSCRLRSLVLRNMLRQDVAFFDTVRPRAMCAGLDNA
jgi:hypothetical protein